MIRVIPVNVPLFDGNEKKYLLECIESGWISSEGPFVRRFEEQFASRVGRRHAVAVANGTAALDIAVEARTASVAETWVVFGGALSGG